MEKEQAEHFMEWIQDTYGSPEAMAQVLDLGVEMLFYLEADTFDLKEIRVVVAALRGMVGVLRDVGKYSRQKVTMACLVCQR